MDISRSIPASVVVLVVLALAVWQPTTAASAEAAPFDPMASSAPAIEPNPKNIDYPVPTTGSVYFVSTTGSDSADGRSLTTPFRSLERALVVAKAGPRPATIVLRGGIYEEGATAAGTMGAYAIDFPVIIQPHRAEKVWLKGSVELTDWTADGATRWRARWITRFCQRPIDAGSDRFCKHPALTNPAYPMAGAQDMVFRDGTALDQVASLREVGPGTFFVDPATDSLYIGDSPAGANVEASNRDAALHIVGWGAGTGGSGTAVKGLGFKHFASEQQTGSYSTERPSKAGAVVIANASNTRFENNTITQSAATGLTAVKAYQAVIRDNLLAVNGYVGANITGTTLADGTARELGLTFDGNRVFRNNTEGLHDNALGGAAESAAGVKITSTAPLTVRDNIFDANDGAGLWCDIDCRNATITRNIARSNTGDGIFVEISQQLIVASNLLTGNGLAGLTIGGSDGVQVYNNTLYDNRSPHTGELYGADLVVFDLLHPDCVLPGCVERWRTRNITIKNNLTSGTKATRLFNASTGVTAPTARVPADTFITAMDFNGYHRTLTTTGAPAPATFAGWLHPRPAADGGPFHVNHASLASLRYFTAADDHGLAFDQAADPFFVNAAGGDFSLQTGSPARGSGEPLPTAVADAIGVPTAPAAANRGALLWPTLQMRTPLDGATVSGSSVPLAAYVPNPAAVTRLEYHVNRVGDPVRTPVGSTTTRGFVFWNTTGMANGSYELRAYAVNGTQAPVQSPPIVVMVHNG